MRTGCQSSGCPGGTATVGTTRTMIRRVRHPGAAKVLKHRRACTPARLTVAKRPADKDIFPARTLSNGTTGTTAPRVFFDSARQWLRCRRAKLGVPGAATAVRSLNLAYARGKDGIWNAITC